MQPPRSLVGKGISFFLITSFWRALQGRFSYALGHRLHRLFLWEYWPFYVFYAPVMVYYAYLALRSGSLFFFTRVNPGIWFGGIRGESKYAILRNIPSQYIPSTHLFKTGADAEQVLSVMEAQGMRFPVVLKPDIGERGRRVEKVVDGTGLRQYVSASTEPFLVQDYVSFPLELGLLYYRRPQAKQGTISSLVIKKPPVIQGDGCTTVEGIMRQGYRLSLHVAYVRRMQPELLNKIPRKGEAVCLSTIGNHACGATFVDARTAITPLLCRMFDALSFRIKGFYYGRYDLRCESLSALSEGKDFKILELNGVASDPAHIYAPAYPLFRAYKEVFAHMRMLDVLARDNSAIPLPSFREKLHFVKVCLGLEKGAGVMTALALGIVLSYAGSLPPGVVNIRVMQAAVCYGYARAMSLSLMASLVEFVYAYIAVKMKVWLSAHMAWEQYVYFFVALLLFFMAVRSFFFSKTHATSTTTQDSETRMQQPGHMHSMIEGIFLGIVNILPIPFWMALTDLSQRMGYLKLEEGTIFLYCTGICLGTFLLFLSYALAGRHLTNLLGGKEKQASRFSLLYVLLGLYFLYKGWMMA